MKSFPGPTRKKTSSAHQSKSKCDQPPTVHLSIPSLQTRARNTNRISQSASQSVSQSINQSINQSVNQSISQSINHSQIAHPRPFQPFPLHKHKHKHKHKQHHTSPHTSSITQHRMRILKQNRPSTQHIYNKSTTFLLTGTLP